MTNAAPRRGLKTFALVCARVRNAMCSAAKEAATAIKADAATSATSYSIGGCIRIAAMPV